MYKIAYIQFTSDDFYNIKELEKELAAVKKMSGFDFEKPLRRKLAMLSDLITASKWFILR